MTRPSPSERLERSAAGQIGISIAIVVVLLALVGTHLPNSVLRSRLGDEASLVAHLTATEQQWGVFAPDPRRTSIDIEARVTFEDGTSAVWELPAGPRLVANLRYYRWRKWLERVRADNYEAIWEPTARWIASLYDDRASPVAQVELVRFFRDNRITGTQPPYQEFTYYTYRVEP